MIQEILKILPRDMALEIASLCRRYGEARELRLRRRGVSLLIFADRSAFLKSVGDSTVDDVFSAVCRGAPYAFRDSIVRGFVPLPGGIRVGVAGRAHYDGGRLVGVSDIESLVFRLPTGSCDFAERITAICRSAPGGVLIFSPPFGGKTTALRAIAAELSRDRRVVIVDEREEIWTAALTGRNIDLLSGYRRAAGIEIATRCLAPEVIITDEIAAEDAEDILAAANSGVPIIATAHAATVGELLAGAHIARLFESGVFSTFVGIYKEDGRFACREESFDR